MSNHRLRAVLRGVIDAEAASDWALLRRVPSTYTWKAIDYVRALDAAEREQFFEAAATNAMSWFQPPAAGPAASDAAVMGRFREAMMSIAADPKYLSVTMLRLVLGDVMGKRPTPRLTETPTAILERAAAIVPTTAAEIRKRLRSRVADRYQAAARTLGGGDWRYAGTWRDQPFELAIDYGGRGDQLRYSVSYTSEDPPRATRRLACEHLVGLGFGRWDFVTATNLDVSLDTLCTLVERAVDVPRLLAGHASGT